MKTTTIRFFRLQNIKYKKLNAIKKDYLFFTLVFGVENLKIAIIPYFFQFYWENLPNLAFNKKGKEEGYKIISIFQYF